MAPSSKEQWDLYDAKGEPLGRTVFRGDPLKGGEYHLVVQVWVRDSRGRYLIQKRSAALTILPGMWATTAGSVLAGESARAGAVRELSEELGIRASEEELKIVLRDLRSHSLGTAWLLERDVADAEIYDHSSGAAGLSGAVGKVPGSSPASGQEFPLRDLPASFSQVL